MSSNGGWVGTMEFTFEQFQSAAKSFYPTVEDRVAALERSWQALSAVHHRDLVALLRDSTPTEPQEGETIFCTPFGDVVRREGVWVDVTGKHDVPVAQRVTL